MPIADRPTTLARNSRLISRVLESLVLITLASKAVPFSLSSPLWFLRLCDDAVSLATALLVAGFLPILGRVFFEASSDELEAINRRAVRMPSRWALVYLLVVPIQLTCFTWLWFDTGQRMQTQLRSSQAQVEELRARVQSTSTESDLVQLLKESGSGTPFPLAPGSLQEKKQQILQAVDLDFVKLKSTLTKRRTTNLVGSLPAALRVLIGAGITSACFYSIRRQLM